jgi:hypothetical protein
VTEDEFDRLFPMDSGILLFVDAHPDRKGVPADYQRHAFLEIMTPYNEYVRAAVKAEDFVTVVRLTARVTQILEKHTRVEYDLLLPTQLMLQEYLHAIGRRARRELIRRTLTCTKAEYPNFIAMLERVVTDDFEEDCAVVKRALAEGRTNIFDDLRRKE